jgi:hypothetical protein
MVFLFRNSSNGPVLDRPVFIAGSGRCGSTLLQSILNTNPDFLIWGEHNGFLRQIAAAYYEAGHPLFPDRDAFSADARIDRLRDSRRWPAWDNLCGEAGYRENFRDLIRAFFADPDGAASRWGFKEIRYPRDEKDQTFPFLFNCFPEAKLIMVVREPRATIFSMLSRWVFPPDRGQILDPEIDTQILVAAESWRAQYAALDSFAQLHPSRCTSVRYEELGSSQTWRGLSAFLETSSFDFKSEMGQVKDAADKSGPMATRIQRRMLEIEPQLEKVIGALAALHGYASQAAGERIAT